MKTVKIVKVRNVILLRNPTMEDFHYTFLFVTCYNIDKSVVSQLVVQSVLE
jgi:hypothetical protein